MNLIISLHPKMKKNNKGKVASKTMWDYIAENKDTEEIKNTVEINNITSWTASNAHIEWECQTGTTSMKKKSFYTRVYERNKLN